ncbi:9674_t:CDS:1, partial [Gigaspora margarita]
RLKAKKSKNQVEIKAFLNDIDIEVLYEQLPEITDENFSKIELKFENLIQNSDLSKI